MRHDRIIDLFDGNTALDELVDGSDSAGLALADQRYPAELPDDVAALSRKHADKSRSKVSRPVTKFPGAA